jgi:uncharacterized protein (DUF302 family)
MPELVSKTEFKIEHRTLRTAAAYAPFTAMLEKLAGRFDPAHVAAAGSNADEVTRRMKAMEGEQGLMIFGILDHGAALQLVGQQKKANQYLIGNPLVAIQMSRHDIRAALYAPLRVLVYEGDGGRAYVDFDLPSSTFGQLGNAEITRVATELDRKLEQLLARAERGETP